jgi:hypothetical protein
MECGLSSIPTTQNRDRPTDLRRYYDTRNRKESQQQGFSTNTFLNIGGILTGQATSARWWHAVDQTGSLADCFQNRHGTLRIDKTGGKISLSVILDSLESL